MSGALRQNGHGGDKLLGTANVSACRKSKKKLKTYVEEQLRGMRRVRVVACEGRGGDCWHNGQELHQASANPKTTEVQCVRHVVKYNDKKKKKGIGMCDLLCAHTPRIVRGQGNNTGTPRV